MTEKQNTNEPLTDLAVRIVACVTPSNEKILEAAKLVGIARRRVENGDAGEITWSAWSTEHIDLSASRMNELWRIAKADDPAAKLREIRDKTCERVAKHRKGRKNPLRNGSGSDNTENPPTILEPDRLQLTAWVSAAPIESVRQVLEFALSLESAPTEPKRDPVSIETEAQRAA